jgi:hypothetical protein
MNRAMNIFIIIVTHDKGQWQSKAVADIGDPSKIPLPVDISIQSDDQMKSRLKSLPHI